MNLAERFDAAKDMGVAFPPVPDHIRTNLAAPVALRPYQEEAIGRFLYYSDTYPQRKSPKHLLFHMATGSGKTVLMAALILDLYARGYRDFLFFVDKTQIVEKTKANFLNPTSSKYLFADAIRIDDRPVAVREVSNFAESDADSINIRFTTLGALHAQLRPGGARENGVTMEDFEQRARGVVLIADEAHHLNAETKAAKGQGELDLRDSWEGTVRAIFETRLDNVMLDFTATQDFRNLDIAAKYEDKILYDFSLKRFREEGYSKDIILRQVGANIPARMMQAVILSEYRRRLAEANGLAIKPVILMKSRQIAESKANKAAFEAAIDALDSNGITGLRAQAVDPTLQRAFAYILDERGTAPADFARELQRQFAGDHLLDANDDKELTQRQVALNTLEDRDNCYRVVFAVDKLNEGWDVLNLFDIVRLYDTAPTNGTSNAEKQLIGRGARYCPFTAPGKPDEPREKRKYDGDTGHELRVLEQLHYHCAHDPDYIRHIKEKLVETGAMAADDRDVLIKLKDGFRQSEFFKTTWVWSNRPIRNERAGVTGFADYGVPTLVDIPRFSGGQVTEGDALGQAAATFGGAEIKTRTVKLDELGAAVMRHALNGSPFFRFDRLRRHFPQLSGMATFIESPQFLGAVSVKLSGPAERLDSLTAADKLAVAHHALRAVEGAIKSRSIETVGSKDFYPEALSALFAEDKTIKVAREGEAGKSWRESPILRDLKLDEKDWFVFDDSYGTDQEKHFIAWVNARADDLRERFEEFYLIRNERVVALYAFEGGEFPGARFEPDFLLFLKDRHEGERVTMQLFVEPKGMQLELNDKWKQDMLRAIGANAVLPVIEGKDYRVYGLSFYNEEAGRKQVFERAFEALAQG